jgi:tRNA1(Val) A37 N6-methylase TrmN6
MPISAVGWPLTMQPEPMADPAGTTLDAFLDGRVQVLQPTTAYRAGLDAVLLAASVPVAAAPRAFCRVLDLGAGVGTVGLCVAARLPDVDVTLLEREPVLLDLARANIARAGVGERVRVVSGDVEHLGADPNLKPDSFDYVLANPPYQIEGRGRSPANALKARAHAMPDGALENWVRTMARLVVPAGMAVMIHRADALGEILAAYSTRFGALTVQPVHPRLNEAASRVLVSGIKGSRAPLRLMTGLVLHETGSHAFTPRVQAILRDGAGLSCV